MARIDVTEWHETIPLLFKKTLIDGTKSSAPMMRRKANGKWEYRAMTDDEMREFLHGDAW